jgi:hypothetical protein
MSLPAGLSYEFGAIKLSTNAVAFADGGVGFDAAGALVTTAAAPTFGVNGNPATALGPVSVIAKASAVSPLNQQNGLTYDANGRLVVVDWLLATTPFSSANGMTFDSSGALIAGDGAALSLDFTIGTLDSRITFTRASTATYTNKSGLIASAAVNEARFEYNPITRACLGLLIEEQRTNLIVDSVPISGTWAVAFSTLTNSSGIAPDGTNAMVKIVATSSAYISLLKSVTVLASTIYTFSWYFDSTNSSLGARYRVFDASNALDILDVAITYSSGITRYAVTFTTPVGCTSIFVYPVSGNVNIGTTFYVWGAQLEAGAFATSYIPTVGASATRSADVAVMTGANFSSWINLAEGCFYTKSLKVDLPNVASITILAAGAADAIQQYMSFTAPVSTVVVGGVNQATLISAGITPNTVVKTAMSYKLNEFRYATNGVSGTPDLSGSIPTSLTTFSIGNNGSNYFNGYIATCKYWNTAKTDAQLQVISLG